jgi:hypothetical protein
LHERRVRMDEPAKGGVSLDFRTGLMSFHYLNMDYPKPLIHLRK